MKEKGRPIFFFFHRHLQQLIRYAEHTHSLVSPCCQAAKTPRGSGGISVLGSGSDWVIPCSGAWHRSPTAISAGSASVLLELCYIQVKSPETSSHPKCLEVTLFFYQRGWKWQRGFPAKGYLWVYGVCPSAATSNKSLVLFQAGFPGTGPVGPAGIPAEIGRTSWAGTTAPCEPSNACGMIFHPQLSRAAVVSRS